MTCTRILAALAAFASLAAAPMARADVVTVGVIGPFSGPFAIVGKNFKAGIDAFVAMNGDTAGGNEVRILYRDLDAADPARAKAIAQQLVVKDKVQYLAGVYFTPDALAIAPLLEQAKTPLVIFNAATSAITQKSPYIVRTSFTMWQNTVPLARAAARDKVGAVVTAVTDYGPGLDAEAAFRSTYEGAGGAVVESLRMPLRTTDFNPIMQRIKMSGAKAVFAFLPAGPPTLAFVKAYLENGLKDAGIALLTTGDVTHEPDLPALGDGALGIRSAYHYSVAHRSPENDAFKAAITPALGGSLDDLDMTAVGAFDGMRVIYRMIETTDGKRDPSAALAAISGMAWTSPRGPVRIDPESRHIRQNVYLRVVAKDSDGRLVNEEVETFPDQPDYGLGR